MAVREIQSYLEEMVGTEVSPTLISSVTDAVMNGIKIWQARPLDALYPTVYLDCIHAKVRDSGAVRVKAVYLALGVNLNGGKELLRLWVAQTEGTKFCAAGRNRTEEPGYAGRLHCLRGWPQGLS